MNISKKLIVCTLALAMVLSMAACGNKAEPAASASASASSEVASVASEAPTPTELTEDDYKAELKRLFADLEKESAAMNGIDLSDAATALEPLKAAVAKVAPLYEEMGNLKAPASLMDKHAIISEGSKASVEILNLSVQILEAGSDAKAEDITALQKKIGEFTPTVTEFGTTLGELIS